MGWWEGIRDAANAIGNAGRRAIRAAGIALAKGLDWLGRVCGQSVSNLLESLGTHLHQSCERAARWVEDLLGPSRWNLLAHLLRWSGRVFLGGFRFAAALAKAGLSVLMILGGFVRLVTGILTVDSGLIDEGARNVVSGASGGVLMIFGAGVGLLQEVVFLQQASRQLSAAELELLSRVFWRSINFANVRLVEGFAGLFSVKQHAFVLGNTIYMKHYDPIRHPALLVHEATHVWQYQHQGPSYVGGALGAQWFSSSDPYQWRSQVDEGVVAQWSDLNLEGQAELLGDIYSQGVLIIGGHETARGEGVFYDADIHGGEARLRIDGTDYSDLSNEAVATVRSAMSIDLFTL